MSDKLLTAIAKARRELAALTRTSHPDSAKANELRLLLAELEKRLETNDAQAK